MALRESEERSEPLKRERSIALTLGLATLAQILGILRVARAAVFFLDLTAILVLRRIFAAQADVPAPMLVAPPPTPSRAAWVLGIAGAVGAATCSWLLYLGFQRYLVLVLLVGPISLLALATGEDGLAGYRWRLDPSTPLRLLRRNGWLLAILVVGAVFRFASMGYFPPPDGISSIEEMQRASGGMQILRGARPWEFPLAQYLAAGSFTLFGFSIHSLRLPVTALAWLTLPVFYALAREIVARPAALFATALLAVSRWHCQVGWYNEDVYVPLFPFVVLLYLLFRTRRDPRPAWYVAAAALCGYMLYDYAAFRGAVGLTLAFFAIDALWWRRRPTELRRIALFLVVFILFVPPLVSVLRRGGANFYTEALARSFADESYYTADALSFLQLRLLRIRQAVDIFTATDHTKFFATLNVPHAPLLDPLTGVFFTLGFGTTLLLPRRRYYAFLVGAFLVLAAGATVVTWNLDFRRLAVLIPFVFLFTALVANEIERAFAVAGRTRLWRRAMFGFAVAAAALNAWFLFFVLAPDHSVRASHRTPYTVALAFLRTHYDDEYVVLLSPDPINFFESNDYDWLKPPRLSGKMARGVEDLLPIDPKPQHGRGVLVLIARPYDIETVMSQVADFYPGAVCAFHADPDHTRHDLGTCRIP